MRGIKIDRADRVFSQFIRLRDKECRRCHSPVQFNDKGLPISHQASHFQGRGKEPTRYDEQNCDTMCAACHMYFTANPGEHYLWQVKTKGQAEVDAIILRSNLYQKKDRTMAYIYWSERLKDML